MALPLPSMAPPGLRALLLGAAQKYGITPPPVVATTPRAPSRPTPADFVSGVLKGIGAPVDAHTKQAMHDWIAAEGGGPTNPLNTTWGQAGAQGAGIKGYGSIQAGIDATVKTLQNGRYNNVIQAFRQSNPTAVRQAVVNSPWDVNHYKGTDYRAALTGGGAMALNGGGGGGGATKMTFPATPGFSMPGLSLLPTNPNPNNMPTRSEAMSSALLRSGGKGLTMSQLLSFSQLPESYPAAKATQLPGINIPGLPALTTGQDGSKPMPNSDFGHMVSMMNQIAGHKYNYEWGGGHNVGFQPTAGVGHGSGPGVGYDCSGAISAILHAAGMLRAPLVASQFMSYGQPGPGGKNDLTIYASPGHVFAELGGRFFGTSMSNPGGGAGWFQRAQTAGYTIRHVSLAGAPAMHLTPQGGLVPFRAA